MLQRYIQKQFPKIQTLQVFVATASNDERESTSERFTFQLEQFSYICVVRLLSVKSVVRLEILGRSAVTWRRDYTVKDCCQCLYYMDQRCGVIQLFVDEELIFQVRLPQRRFPPPPLTNLGWPCPASRWLLYKEKVSCF